MNLKKSTGILHWKKVDNAEKIKRDVNKLKWIKYLAINYFVNAFVRMEWNFYSEQLPQAGPRKCRSAPLSSMDSHARSYHVGEFWERKPRGPIFKLSVKDFLS